MMAMRHRVLHLINGEFYAGAERVQDLLALQLGRYGFDVEFACLKPGRFPAERQARSVDLHAVPMRSNLDLAGCRTLARLVRRRGFDLLHSHTTRSALIGNLVSRATGLPWVHHVHSPSRQDTEQGLRNLRNTLVDRLALGRARKLICVSESLARRLETDGVEPRRLARVPNGVPCGDQRARHPTTRAGSGALVIGTVALFRPRKGLESLLEALALLRDEPRPVHLLAIGPFESPDYESAIRGQAARLGVESRITWTGFTADVGAALAELDVFVLPSLYGEGMPMALLEAMAEGLPVVATDIDGVSEVVREGADGLLVAPGDGAAMAAALRRFARGETDAAEMGRRALLRQREQFSDVVMAARVAAVYREVLQS
jgi:glycosyltransferase involved in cell wall biosynthesis